MINVCNGISSEVGFSKDVDKLDVLELGGKPLNIFDNHLESPRDITLIKNTINDKLRISFHLNFEEILTDHYTKTFPKSKSFRNGNMISRNFSSTNKNWTPLLISYEL